MTSNFKLKILPVATMLVFNLSVFLFSCNEKRSYIKTKDSMQIEVAPWGVEFNALPPHIDKYPGDLEKITPEHVDSLLKLVSELGVKWVRLSVNWSNIVDTAGNYHWTKIDQIVQGLAARKIEISLCINGGHKRYTQSRAPETSEEIEWWKEFTGQLIERYKANVSHWELWNEPNTIWFWKPRPKAEKYVALMKEFYTLLKEIDPKAKITGGSLARLDLVYADSLFQLGLGKYIDAFSFHPYNEFPEAIINPVRVSVKTPNWYIESDHNINQLKEIVDSVNPAIKLWQGECGYPSQDNGSGWMGNGPWSPNIQAKWLLRRMLTDLSFNAEVSSYFCMVEYIAGGNVDEGKGIVNSKGLLSLKDLSKKPAYKAYQNLISTLNGRLKANMSTNYQAEITDEGSFYNIQQKNLRFVEIQDEHGSNYLAFWIAWRMQDMVHNACATIQTGAPFHVPVLVNLLTGEITKIKFVTKDNFQQLLEVPLADFPFVIAEAENIEVDSK